MNNLRNTLFDIALIIPMILGFGLAIMFNNYGFVVLTMYIILLVMFYFGGYKKSVIRIATLSIVIGVAVNLDIHQRNIQESLAIYRQQDVQERLQRMNEQIQKLSETRNNTHWISKTLYESFGSEANK